MNEERAVRCELCGFLQHAVAEYCLVGIGLVCDVQRCLTAMDTTELRKHVVCSNRSCHEVMLEGEAKQVSELAWNDP